MLDGLINILEDVLLKFHLQSSHDDCDKLINILSGQGVDLSQYNIEEIKESLRSAFPTKVDSVNMDNLMETDENSHSMEINANECMRICIAGYVGDSSYGAKYNFGYNRS